MFEDFISFCFSDVDLNGSEILEFGCGPGPVLAKLLENEGAKVTKYDKFFFDDESYKEKKYDFITSTEVFEHLQHPKESLAELAELLKPGGMIAIMTNFHLNDTDRFLKWWYRRDPTHISFFNKRVFEVLTKKLNLTIKRCDNRKIITLVK
jgi:2-polyprenyl-3-methyl-5-hydroxy-6-metoxy-1,4-benzoquinol methylase